MGFEVQDYPIVLHTALSFSPKSLPGVTEAISTCHESHTDKLILPIFTDEYLIQLSKSEQIEHKKLLDLSQCLIPSDIYFKKNYYHLFSPMVNQMVWENYFPQSIRDKLLKTIAGYSSFLNLQNYIMKINFNGDEQSDLALIQRIIKCMSNCKQDLTRCGSRLVVMIETNGSGDQSENYAKNELIWKHYINLRNKIDGVFNKKLELELGVHLQGNLPKALILNRWKSQALAYIEIGEQCFIENSKGFKTLPGMHQRVFLEFANLKTAIIIRFENLSHRVPQSFKYCEFSFRKMALNTLKSEREAINLTDFLQDPLQPYADNLQSLTYQIFENDTVKYDEYQGALEDALETFEKKKRIVIYYIGSGRGALLFNAFAAAKKKQRKIFVYVIEKNPYPLQTVRQRAIQNKWDNIKIIETDIRDYEMPEKADIFLSELLGGFGDNQLSPECLCWAEKNIAEDTICIPNSYESYVKPVSYQGVHRRMPKQARHVYYTVNYGNYFTNFPSKPVWEFKHPLKEKQKQFNKESGWVQFEAKTPIVINGFAGYFTTQLYNFSELSILPQRPSFGSYSWFPLFFPFDKPVQLDAGQKIGIRMSRKHTEKGVWYEWQYSCEGKQSIVHNENGFGIMIEL